MVVGSLEFPIPSLSTSLDATSSKHGTLSPPEEGYLPYRLLLKTSLSSSQRFQKPGMSSKPSIQSFSNQFSKLDQGESRILIPVLKPQLSSLEIRKVLIPLNKTT